MRRYFLGAFVGFACQGANSNTGDGGSGNVSYSCTIVSGSRLRANYWRTDDGGKYFAGTWYDTILGHDCAFGTVPGDTTVYCLPTSDGISAARYSDSQCTVPVVDVDPACSVSAPIFAFTSLTTSGSSRDFYPIAEAYTGPLWQLSNGCRPSTDPAPAGYAYHTVGVPLDKSTFAVAAPYAGVAPTRLQATGYAAADGAIQACNALTFFDSQRNEKCYAGADSIGEKRCLPSGYSFSGAVMFSDSSCVTPAAQLSSTTYEATSVRLTCGTGTRLHQLSGPLTTEYTNLSGSCTVVSPTRPSYYTAGAEITPDHFVGLTDVPFAIGGQRLQEIVQATPDGFGMATGTFIDSQLNGATCRFSTASDGTTRCLPGDPAHQAKIGSVYSGSCTIPISIITPDCSGTTPQFAQSVDSASMAASCSYQGVTHAFSVGAKVTDTLYQVSGATCVESTDSGNAYELSAELPPSTFVQATLVAD